MVVEETNEAKDEQHRITRSDILLTDGTTWAYDRAGSSRDERDHRDRFYETIDWRW